MKNLLKLKGLTLTKKELKLIIGNGSLHIGGGNGNGNGSVNECSNLTTAILICNCRKKLGLPLLDDCKDSYINGQFTD